LINSFNTAPVVPDSAIDGDLTPRESGISLSVNLDVYALADPVTGETAIGKSIFISIKAIDEEGLESDVPAPVRADVSLFFYNTLK